MTPQTTQPLSKEQWIAAAYRELCLRTGYPKNKREERYCADGAQRLQQEYLPLTQPTEPTAKQGVMI